MLQSCPICPQIHPAEGPGSTTMAYYEIQPKFHVPAPPPTHPQEARLAKLTNVGVSSGLATHTVLWLDFHIFKINPIMG